MGIVIDGKALARQEQEHLKQEVASLLPTLGRPPHLAVVLVGEDPASAAYVRNKGRAGRRVGMDIVIHRLPVDITQARLIDTVTRLSDDPNVDGLIVQLPLSDGLDAREAILAVDHQKDVDGFHPYNQGLLWADTPLFVPPTPAAALRLLDSVGVDLKGKRATVIGRSSIVGKPVAALLLARHATVTLCHSRTTDLKAAVAQAQVVIAAAGRAGLIQGDWIAPGAVVIDVGMNALADGTLTGDVDFPQAVERASYITPVPGGVGPMTVTMLLKNTLIAARRRLAR